MLNIFFNELDGDEVYYYDCCVMGIKFVIVLVIIVIVLMMVVWFMEGYYIKRYDNRITRLWREHVIGVWDDEDDF
jgi:hypothetical protein